MSEQYIEYIQKTLLGDKGRGLAVQEGGIVYQPDDTKQIQSKTPTTARQKSMEGVKA